MWDRAAAEGDEVLIGDVSPATAIGYCVEADADGRSRLASIRCQTGQVNDEVRLNRLQRLED